MVPIHTPLVAVLNTRPDFIEIMIEILEMEGFNTISEFVTTFGCLSLESLPHPDQEYRRERKADNESVRSVALHMHRSSSVVAALLQRRDRRRETNT